MKVKYLGPRQSVMVAGYGEHKAGAIKDYPDAFANELLSTSKRQKFEAVDVPRPAGMKRSISDDKKK